MLDFLHPRAQGLDGVVVAHRDRLGHDHGPGVDALVDVVDGGRGLARRPPRARPRSGARPGTRGAAPSACSRPGRSARGTRAAAGACTRRRRPASRRARRASRPWPRLAARGSRSRRARTPRVGIPAASARSSARAPALFEATADTGSPASISACRFVPSPETSTPITSRVRSRARRPRPRPERPRTSRSPR